MQRREDQRTRTRRERQALKLKPWQLLPGDVDDGPPPHPPGTSGYEAWLQAQFIKVKMKEVSEGEDDDEDSLSPA